MLLAVSFLVVGCICPPCPEDAASAAAEDTPSAPVAAGDSRLIWDGDSAGSKADGWADCDTKPGCKATVAMDSSGGVDGSAGLHFHASGPKWIGMGWNWFGWWPENAGIDISGYDVLRFSLRFDVPKPADAPDPSAVTVALVCSNGKQGSASVALDRYLKNPGDGKWHEVEIPLSEFYKGKDGQKFDPKTAWELTFGTWAGSTRTFDAYIDNISVHKK